MARGSAAPLVIGAALTGQKETEGTLSVVAALGIATAGVHLINLDAVLTALRQTPTLNNGNAYGSVLTDQAYGPEFAQYDIEVRADAAAAGGSNHQSTMTKTGSPAVEATHALLAVRGGTVIEATSVNRTSTPGVATHASASFDITGSLPALAMAFWSGSGFSLGSTVQDAQIASPGWADIIGNVNGGASGVFKFVHSGVSAPDGHIPLRGWARVLQPGTGYTWQATPDYQVAAGQAEGGVLITVVVR